jgi:hypothetical protein
MIIADVWEMPQEWLILKEEPKQWNFGTVGHGIDLLRMVWPQLNHAFSSQI